MEDLLRMLTCPCRHENGAVTCRCPDLAPSFRCSCANCIAQRLARIEDMDLPFQQCSYEAGASDAEPMQAGIAKMLGVPVTTRVVCVLRDGHAGKHQTVPLPGRAR